MVVSGRNTGSKPMNLSAIVGSINSAEKYDMFIQNFTIGVRRRPAQASLRQSAGAMAAGPARAAGDKSMSAGRSQQQRRQ